MCLLVKILDYFYIHAVFKKPTYLFSTLKFNELSKDNLCLLFDQHFKRPCTLLKVFRMIKL